MKKRMLSRRSKLLLATSALALMSLDALSQSNLIPNGNFESIASYPIIQTQANASNVFPTNWTMPTDGTPDVISDNANTCDYFYTPSPVSCYPKVCEFDNVWGCQTMMPATSVYSAGHVYMGLHTLGTSGQFSNSVEFREYLKCTLNISGGLDPGQCYQLKYWVSLADLSSRGATVQALITDQDLTNMNDFAGVLDASPYPLWFKPRHAITNKQGWVELTYDFIAEGGETFLYLGFFENESSPTIDQNVYDVALDCNYSSCMSNSAYTNSNNLAAYYYVDNVSLYATASPTFTPSSGCTFNASNPNISGVFSNQNILISGNVFISANTTFDNCMVKCNDGSTITVYSGKTFSVLNETVIEAGCNNMWDGIRLIGGTLVVRGSRISDARVAIHSNSPSSVWNIYRDASNNFNTFSRNTVDMLIDASYGTTFNYVKGTLFDHSVPLHDPNEGNGGYGTHNIVLTGLLNSAHEIIGGTSTGEACFFYGGQNGILSAKYDVTIKNCTFSGQSDHAVHFTGTEPTTRRTLTVTGCTFLASRKHILSERNTNLTVQSSSFSNAEENSIEWSNNHDCDLLIGHESNSALGNTFTDNGWYAVVAMHNTTFQLDPDKLYQEIDQSLNPAQYTSIIIGENTVHCLPYSSGILIAEWQLGWAASYHELNVISNTIYDTYNGIQLYNVRGWGGVWPSLPTLSMPPQQVMYNMSYTSTQFALNPTGVKVINAPGFVISENGVSSDNSFNYANTGIYSQNSPFSEVYGNIISAGSCITASQYMNGSNMHCNWLTAYSTGFVLDNATLRQGSGVTHGIPVTEQYNNLVPYGMFPWNWDIHNYNSDVQYNQWIWNGAATNLTIQNTGNTGFGPLISNLTGADLCEDGIFPGYPVFDDNVDMNLTGDPVAQWIADYHYEVLRRIHADGSDTVASANIKTILDLEALLAAGEYADALTDLGGFTPANDIEQHYADVLTIFATLGDEGNRLTNTTEKDDLIAIAELDPRTAGPAVLLARAYLEANYYLHFSDPRLLENDEIHGTANLSSPCELAPESGTWLSFMDEDGNDLEIEGCYVTSNGEFVFDPIEVAYHDNLNGSTRYRIFSKHGSTYTVVSDEFHTLGEWLTESPFSLDLAGAHVEIDTITDSMIEDYDDHVSATDGDNTYNVGYVAAGGQTDFFIEKRDRNNNLVWTRTWDGPVNANDTATCITMDSGGENIYVAGKVWNGSSYDLQVLKYTAAGVLIWSAILADDEMRDHTPDGIYIDDNDLTVHVSGTWDDGTNTGYRYTKLWQCLPGSSRLAPPAEETPISTTAPAEFYPSPSNGKLTVVLKGETGGMLELFNMEGQIVYTRQIMQTGEIELPATIVDGIYLLKFTGEGEPYHQKLIIQRNQ